MCIVHLNLGDTISTINNTSQNNQLPVLFDNTAPEATSCVSVCVRVHVCACMFHSVCLSMCRCILVYHPSNTVHFTSTATAAHEKTCLQTHRQTNYNNPPAVNKLNLLVGKWVMTLVTVGLLDLAT